MSGDPCPSYEELAALVAAQAEWIAQLQAEIAQLRGQLGQNSRNSSKPPSSDSPFVKPAPRSLCRKSGRKPGGQSGHPGSTLAQIADPNETVRHEPGPCGGCGADLADAPEAGVERRQVFDLPPMTVRVTEHQLISRRCACGATTCGTAPQGVTAPVQYGPRITAIIVYLYIGQFLSKKRTATALAELFGTPVSEGTVAAMTTRAAEGLDQIRDIDLRSWCRPDPSPPAAGQRPTPRVDHHMRQRVHSHVPGRRAIRRAQHTAPNTGHHHDQVPEHPHALPIVIDAHAVTSNRHGRVTATTSAR